MSTSNVLKMFLGMIVDIGSISVNFHPHELTKNIHVNNLPWLARKVEL